MTGVQKSSPSVIDLCFRLALTGIVIVMLWLGLQFMTLTHRISATTGYEAGRFDHQSPEDLRAADLEVMRARFPLPLYVGAYDMEFGEMEFNGRPFFRCDYDVSAPPEAVLAFYRQQLRARGWSDTTEDAVRGAAIVNSEQIESIDFQNENFLRYYDQMMKTQASFTRYNGHVLVAVKPGSQPWVSRVGVNYIEYGSPEELVQDLQRTLGVNHNNASGVQPATFAQTLGGQRAETTIQTSRSSPSEFLSELTRHYVREGWKEVGLSQLPASDSEQTATLMMGGRIIFIHVSAEAGQDMSRAMIMTMGPR